MADPAPHTAISVVIEGEGARAWAEVAGAGDPASITPEGLLQAAAGEGVALTDAVRARAGEAARELAPRGGRVLLAEATAPTHGRDASLVWCEGFCPSSERRPGGEGGAVDYYNAVEYIRVRRGDRVADLTPATEGRAGQDVLGRVLPCVPGKALGVALEPGSFAVDESGCVTAAMDGVLIAARNAVRITRVIEVPEYVDFHTGNITAEGSVHVRKGVRDRFKVTATEGVCVDGLVESAEIACDGDLLLRQGMAAREGGGLRVGGDAEAGFLNSATVRVGGRLSVRRELMNCTTEVEGDLLAAGARVIGGATAVGGAAQVERLGSAGQVRTVMVLGTVPLREARARGLRALGERLDAAGQQELERLEREIDSLRRVDLTIGKLLHARTVLVVDGVEMVVTTDLKGPARIEWDRSRRLTVRFGSGPSQSLSDYVSVGGVPGGLPRAA